MCNTAAGCSDPTGDPDSSLIVPLPNVCDCTLRKVLQYCERSSGHGTEKSGMCPAAAAPALAKHRLEWEQKYMQVLMFRHPRMHPAIFDAGMHACMHPSRTLQVAPYLLLFVPCGQACAAMPQIEVDELYHLVMAAHYLDVPGLLALCCDAIADAIRNKSAEQIRQHFGLMDNLTAGEVEETTCVNQWAWC